MKIFEFQYVIIQIFSYTLIFATLMIFLYQVDNDVFCCIFSSIDVDWVGDMIFVAEEKGVIYTIKLKHMVDRSKPPDVDIALVYNGSTIPRAITVHPQKG